MPELALLSLASSEEDASVSSRAEVARWLRHADHHEAVGELVKLGPEVVPLLLAARNRRGHLRALDALGRLGAAARPALDALVSDLCHRSGNVRLAAATALGRIGGPEAIAALERTLCQPNARWWLRAAAVRALAPHPSSRLALVRTARADRDRRTRLVAIECLLQIAPGEVDEAMRREVAAALGAENPQLNEIASRVAAALSGSGSSLPDDEYERHLDVG